MGPILPIVLRIRALAALGQSIHYQCGSGSYPTEGSSGVHDNLQRLSLHVFMKIQPFISSLWQKRWDKEVANKLHAIMPQIDDKYYSGCKNRKDEVIINRLRIGHTRLTHSFRMENRPNPPLCDQCEGDHELTVKHILIECNFLKIIRRRHYDVTDLNQLFKTVSSKRILDFVKDIGLYNSL